MNLARSALKDRIDHLSRLIHHSQSSPPSPRNSILLASSDNRISSTPSNASLDDLLDNHSLLAEVADKNRYIATLEKRLLQARRSSHTRNSIGPGARELPENKTEVLLREKDMEIEELRKRLEDKERMVVALRSVVRKREFAEGRESLNRQSREVMQRQSRESLGLQQSRESSVIRQSRESLGLRQSRESLGEVGMGVGRESTLVEREGTF